MFPDDIELARIFGYHPPKDETVAEAHEQVRGLGFEFARALRDTCPASRELERAIEAVDDAVKHANAAIARHGNGP